MARKPLVPGEFGAWVLNVRTNYLRWTPEQLAYYAGVPTWLIDGLETGHIQDTDSTNKSKIVKAVEIAYQGPGR
jgi:hypothetical protein